MRYRKDPMDVALELDERDEHSPIYTAGQLQRDLDLIGFELFSRSNAARQLGMTGLADALEMFGLEVREKGAALYKCWQMEFNRRMDDGKEATGNMVMAALAACGVAPPEAKDEEAEDWADVMPPDC